MMPGHMCDALQYSVITVVVFDKRLKVGTIIHFESGSVTLR